MRLAIRDRVLASGAVLAAVALALHLVQIIGLGIVLFTRRLRRVS